MKRRNENTKSLFQILIHPFTCWLRGVVKESRVCVIFVHLFLSSFLVVACSFQKIEDLKLEDKLKAEFSLPVGRVNFTVDEMIDRIGLFPVLPDTFTSPVNLFIYEGRYYQFPVQWSVTEVTEFNLKPLAKNLNDIYYLIVRVNCVNHSLATIHTQVYMRASDYTEPVDSVFSGGELKIKGGEVDKDNVVFPFYLLRHDELFTPQRVQELDNVSHLDVKVTFDFPQELSPPIIVEHGTMFELQIGVQTGVEGNPNEI
jgi:hypothetical protein